MKKKKQIKARLSLETRQAMMRNAAGKHPDKKKKANREACRKGNW
jgi:hypothetical protein